MSRAFTEPVRSFGITAYACSHYVPHIRAFQYYAKYNRIPACQEHSLFRDAARFGPASEAPSGRKFLTVVSPDPFVDHRVYIPELNGSMYHINPCYEVVDGEATYASSFNPTFDCPEPFYQGKVASRSYVNGGLLKMCILFILGVEVIVTPLVPEQYTNFKLFSRLSKKFSLATTNRHMEDIWQQQTKRWLRQTTL